MAELGISKEVVQNSGSVIGASEAKEIIKIQETHLKNNRLKIPLLFMADIIHGFKTIFPIPLAIGCSWDLELAEKSAGIAALEASVSGIHVTFAPMADLVRDPRWGRVMESTGEDPYLNSQFAKAFVRGFQGPELKNDPNRLAACVKHFAAYGAPEGGRDYNTVDMSERKLRNIICLHISLLWMRVRKWSWLLLTQLTAFRRLGTESFCAESFGKSGILMVYSFPIGDQWVS